MQATRRFDAAIFDFDGVVCDTIPIHFESYHRLFAEVGVAFSFEDYMRIANGAPRHRVIRMVMGDDIPGEQFDHLMSRKQEIVLEIAENEGLRPIEGVLDLVQALRSEGLRIGIGSSSRTAVLFLRTMGVESFFDATTDALDTTRSKPDPEVFLATARKLEVEPTRCLVVEDAKIGIDAACAADMKVLAITSTTTPEVLADADWIIESFVGFDARTLLYEEA